MFKIAKVFILFTIFILAFFFAYTASSIAASVNACQCSDNLDNDLDGLVDFPDDPGCLSANDPEEFNMPQPLLPQVSSGTFKVGGLVYYPQTELGPNLLANPSFEELNKNGKPLGWVASAAFSLDDSVAKNGKYSYRLKDAPLHKYSEIAKQLIPNLKKGNYRISGWIKPEAIGVDALNGSVRISFGAAFGKPGGGGVSVKVKGTSDWQYIEKRNIVITEDIDANFKLEAYCEPDGTAWFDDLGLREEMQPPIDVFMLYPNYRGILFDDQSQALRFDLTINPPGTSAVSDYRLEAVVINERNLSVVLSKTFASQKNLTVLLDAGDFLNYETYLVRFKLVKISDGIPLYEYPAYRISKLPGSLRDSLAVSFDEDNRILLNGKPGFILGVYDSGLGYAPSEYVWERIFTDYRRLFELPINFYNNYWYGKAPVASLSKMSNVLQSRGIYFLHTGNCFGEGEWKPSEFPIYTDDAYLAGLSGISGLAGFYTMDECVPESSQGVFNSTARLKAFKPGGITFGSSNQKDSLFYWRDTVDLLSMDPYPLYGAQPQDGYNLAQVANEVKATKDALKNSRPFAAVIQFFKFGSAARWPTRDELRNMSYMAIAEGANGLFYWSLGVNGLAYTCNGSSEYYSPKGTTSWCPAKIDNFNNLKDVITELDSLKPALSGFDRPDLLLDNSNPSVHTRVKFTEDKVYLIAYNYTKDNLLAKFTWAKPLAAVEVFNESRSLDFSKNAFSDSFGPYQAHVYEIDMNIITADTQPPTAPADPVAKAVSPYRINLSWSASVDNVGVVGYKLYRGNNRIAVLSGTSYADTGLLPLINYSYKVYAYDAAGNLSGSSPSFSATTFALPNNPPVLAYIGDKTVDENKTLSFVISAADAQGDLLSYSASGLPTGAQFNSLDRVFSWRPNYQQQGSYQVTFSVVDNKGGSDCETITITVKDITSSAGPLGLISVPVGTIKVAPSPFSWLFNFAYFKQLFIKKLLLPSKK
jgi:chitodextrinase